MAITYEIVEEFTGTRTTSTPDPDNEGETIDTSVDVTDVEVTFTDDSYSPSKTHTRFVNVCFDEDGNYDNDATLVRISEVMSGVENKMKIGVIA